jgi:hypothetical protein
MYKDIKRFKTLEYILLLEKWAKAQVNIRNY